MTLVVCLSFLERCGRRAGPQSPATEFRGAAKTRTRGGQDPDTEPGHRAQPQSCCILGGQEGDKAQPQSPATELTEFRGAATRRTRGGQGPATELTESRGAAKRRTRPSHRVDRVQGRGQEEDKRRTRPSHRAQPQSPATEPSHRVQGRGQ